MHHRKKQRRRYFVMSLMALLVTTAMVGENFLNQEDKNVNAAGEYQQSENFTPYTIVVEEQETQPESNLQIEEQEEDITVDYYTIYSNVNETTGMSKSQFLRIMYNIKYDTGFFEKYADDIYDICQTYDINEIFFCAIIAAESGWGQSEYAIATNNFTSMQYNGENIRYDSVKANLSATAENLRENYFTEGGKFYTGGVVVNIGEKYCENHVWPQLVVECMNMIVACTEE